MTYVDHPVAVMVALDQTESVIGVSDPPPSVYELAIPARLSIEDVPDPPQALARRRRVFRLSHYRSPSHQWLRVYNDGRSATPESAYVYFEERQP